MSSKLKVTTKNAPDLMPDVLSQAIVSNNTVYCSGAVGIDPSTKTLVSGTVTDRTHQCIRNLAAVLAAADSSLDNVLKVNVFLADMADFAAMNEAYKTYWGAVKPSRTCVAVKQLPLGTDVEIECVAVVSPRSNKL
ncbi:hypothetical protein WHR41_02710 [Cladosporium halotolerans]|uniref:Uncharacterized protein n=1 Tax=Cladosporium halotolerans TaxID=1052096 RepID=A0AB34KYA1_9PEZI